jgi:hypothetical protein
VVLVLETMGRICVVVCVVGSWPGGARAQPIDRQALVERHQVVLRGCDIQPRLYNRSSRRD